MAVATIEDFIAHWQGADGGERSQSQSFLAGFCRVLGLPEPKDGDYKFEYPVPGDHGTDFIDLYKRGAFVLEAKQSRAKGQRKSVEGQGDLFTLSKPTAKPSAKPAPRSWDVLMLNARQQAENYARHLPSAHEWPPFIIVCDVGHCFELYADFTGKGRNYTQFPDRQGFRIGLGDLAKPDVQNLFRILWSDPHALDPTKRAAKATREIAQALADVSKRMEANNHPPEDVALFLMRCLFTMFAEDVELIPKNSFTDLLTNCAASPQSFVPMVTELWKQMNGGGFAVAIAAHVPKFNGNLFANAHVFPVDREDIGVLRMAASKDWKEVDPSIFGTLLEQALDPAERSRLGAHYTPRAYVERLVNATVIEPLREKWRNVQGSLEREGEGALKLVTDFHQELCELRILDPACGTGNFLYVTLELLKRLEGEVLDMIERLGGQDALRLERFTVDPHQFLGLELNPRAAAIAELVLWIGYLRWHLRTRGEAPDEPILREFKNIEKKDAVLAHDGVDAKGKYKNPRRPEWPDADYIVGNPPFVGNKRMRRRLGDYYVDALRATRTGVPDSADFVMYWWDRAADIVTAAGTRLKRFGFVTTNSITDIYQRQIVEEHLSNKKPLSIVFAVPDHPWTKVTTDSAVVRIAMTVARAGKHQGQIQSLVTESGLDTDDPQLSFAATSGVINSDLTIGADSSQATQLLSNKNIGFRGITYLGSGFVLDSKSATMFGAMDLNGKVIKPYLSGRDVTGKPRTVSIIDLFGLTLDEARDRYPILYQHLHNTVRPVRQQDRRESYREKWWLFAEPRTEFRQAVRECSKYIVTSQTAKHLTFQFIDGKVLPDQTLVAIASDDPLLLGVLSSRHHSVWCDQLGATLEDRPRYTNSYCFDPFPFPTPDEFTRARIADLGERIDRHRKQVQAQHPDITLTQMYNVLEKLKPASAATPTPTPPHKGEGLAGSSLPAVPQVGGEETQPAKPLPLVGRGWGGGPQGTLLTPAEDSILQRGLILILKELHEELDAAVAQAYGWPADLNDDEILTRLVALNKERAAEEARGLVRWLRPSYQIPRFGTAKEKAEQLEADLGLPIAAAKTKPSFPQGAVEQTAAVMAALGSSASPQSAGDLAQSFKQGRKAEARIAATLVSLARSGFIAVHDGGRKFALRRVA